MVGNTLTITLTDDHRKQIKAASGRSITELNIDLASLSSLSEKDLDQVAGGAIDIFLKQ